jgi:FkbM family methyltransferase
MKDFLETIQGPLGPFVIPATPENTRDHAKWICEMVWAGEYDAPGLPNDILSAIDIGSHCGAFAVWAAAKWPTLREIHCYDPNVYACDMLRENVRDRSSLMDVAVVDGQVPTSIQNVAVTSDPFPRFACSWDWGSAKTHDVGPAEGSPCAAIHPRDLPAVDVLKCDGEGIEVDVLTHYQHWNGLKALLYEFHSLEHKAILADMARAHGFRCLREENAATYGSSIWTR